MELMQIMKALSDETRTRILNLLMYSELCVGELEHILKINQSNTSRHLSTLKNAKLITYEKKAQWIYYKVNEEALSRYGFLKVLLKDELPSIEKYAEDIKNLKNYKDSGKSCSDLKECEITKCNEDCEIGKCNG